MARWEPNARARLATAALELFEERGYEQTTVTDIAAAAGLTERTFFRHFADKREVLFDGSAALAELMRTAVLTAPADASAQEAVRHALAATEPFFESRRDHARRRQCVLTADPVLLERELSKLAALTGTLAAALQERGIGEPTATVAAEVGMLVFRLGFTRWLTDDRPLSSVFDDTYAQVRALGGAA